MALSAIEARRLRATQAQKNNPSAQDAKPSVQIAPRAAPLPADVPDTSSESKRPRPSRPAESSTDRTDGSAGGPAGPTQVPREDVEPILKKRRVLARSDSQLASVDSDSPSADSSSSSEEDVSEGSEYEEEQDEKDMPLSTFSVHFSGSKRNCMDEGGSFVLGLGPSEQFAFVGMARIEVLAGEALLDGVPLLSPKSIYLICPRSAPVPLLVASKDSRSTTKNPSTALPDGWDKSKFACIIRVRPLSPGQVGLEQIGLVCPFALGKAPQGIDGAPACPSPFDWPIPAGSDAQQLVKPLFVPVHNRTTSTVCNGGKGTFEGHLRCLNNDPEWDLAQSKVIHHPTPPIVLLHGPKSSGKSTMARRLLTALRASSSRPVAFLDLDPGQPEFGPPGQVALHVFEPEEDLLVGPRWATMHTPRRAHWLGTSTGQDDPRTYLDAAKDLAHFHNSLSLGRQVEVQGQGKRRKWKSEFASQAVHNIEMPLIVNTMGWVKGLGADLEREIVRFTRPTHLFCLSDGEGEVNQLAPAELGVSKKAVITVPAHGKKQAASAAADSRTLGLMSYLFLSQLADTTHPLPRWDFSVPLLARQPLVAQLPAALPRGIHLPFHAGCAHGTAEKVNARLVGVIKSSGDPRYASFSECLGVALVRAVEQGCQGPEAVQLITPISTDVISSAAGDLGLVLAGPSLSTPVWAFLDAPECRASFWLARGRRWKTCERPGRVSEMTVAGVPISMAPYLDWPADLLPEGREPPKALGSKKRTTRRNLQRGVHRR